MGPLELKRSEGPTQAAAAGGESPSSGVSILPAGIAPPPSHFLLAADPGRISRSFAASFASHFLAFALIALIISLTPDRVLEVVERNRQNYPSIVWIPEPGPGGGGGGGGNESLEAPRLVELEGPDETELSVPVEPEPELTAPEPEPPEPDPPPQEVTISAVPVAASLETLPGVMDALVEASLASQGSGIGGGGGTGEGAGIGPGQGDGLGPGEGGGTGGGAYRPGNNVSVPRPLAQVGPRYTAEAMRAMVQGEVWVEAVVLPDGTVGEVTVTKSLDPVFGLDEEAIIAAKQWLFEPGMRFGEPVPVLVTIELSFTLR